LVTLLHEVLCRLPDPPRVESYHSGRRCTGIEMCASALGQIATTPRTQVRTCAQWICRKFRHPEAHVAAEAVGNHMIRTVDKEQGALFGSQGVRPLAVNVR
jgi:hypothetical protein